MNIGKVGSSIQSERKDL